MDFAKRILGKYGWKEGDGLGKNNNGIVKPLKASMKFDNAGLGADAASDFNNHWWERVFNDAANNVDIKVKEDGAVSMDVKNVDDTVEITTKGYSLKKLKKAKASAGDQAGRYDNFLQSATLTKGGDEVENPDKIAVADIAVTQIKVLSDEELFRACGGRTAHKGARHGLKLSGKLSRIEQQEQELLARMQSRLKSKSDVADDVKKAKKRKSFKDDEQNIENEDDVATHTKVKKSRKKSKMVVKEIESQQNDCDSMAEVAEVVEPVESGAEEKQHKKKKKKSKKQQDDVEQIPETEIPSEHMRKKQKKRKEIESTSKSAINVENVNKRSKK